MCEDSEIRQKMDGKNRSQIGARGNSRNFGREIIAYCQKFGWWARPRPEQSPDLEEIRASKAALERERAGQANFWNFPLIFQRPA
jgi:hypothetical protein